DYGVLWVMRYEDARLNGMGVREALLHTTTHVAIGNLTAASTLALAFFTAIFADFKAVAELGWIAGCGVLLCAFACFTVLPALLMLCDRRTLNDEGGRMKDESEGPLVHPSSFLLPPSKGDVWSPRLRRRAGAVLAVGLLLVLGVGSFAAKVRYDHNLLHL